LKGIVHLLATSGQHGIKLCTFYVCIGEKEGYNGGSRKGRRPSKQPPRYKEGEKAGPPGIAAKSIRGKKHRLEDVIIYISYKK
jgi:hypothetical protein